MLTQCDETEKQREEDHKEAHIRFKQTVERFFNKLQAEENKYRTRMEELEVKKSVNCTNSTSSVTSSVRSAYSIQANC